MSTLKETLISRAPELRLLKIKGRISLCEWLIYKANLISSIAKYLLLK